MKLTDYIVQFLTENNINKMFVFTGGAIANLIDSAYERSIYKGDFDPICVMHEQAGSMALDGYVRSTGKLASMAVTSGPGATNLVTGIACSYYDSIPGIYFTGQVRTWELKNDDRQRQWGFQETDIVKIISPITKYAVTILNPEEIRYELEKALWLTKSGRPGPVLIDLPMDIQMADINPDNLRSFEPSKPEPINSRNYLTKITVVSEWLKLAKKPMIICGGGIRNSKGISILKELSEKYQIPVCVTFNGTDSFDHNNTLFSGLIGTMGNSASNTLINESDLVLAVGTRLSLRQVRSKPESFVNNGKLVHVDIDIEELDKKVPTDLSICCDARVFLINLLKDMESKKIQEFSEWAFYAKNLFDSNPFCKEEYYSEKYVNPYVFMKTLSSAMNPKDILVADAGQNVMWAIQSFEVHGEQRLFTAAAHSPMGYSLPAAMGAALEHLDEEIHVVCTIGDGAIQLNVQELQTLFSYEIPVKIFVLNNHSYGAIMDYQDQALDSRYYASSVEFGYSIPDIIAIAKAYKIKTFQIDSMDNLKDNIKRVLNEKGPVLCEVNLGNRTHVTLAP